MHNTSYVVLHARARGLTLDHKLTMTHHLRIQGMLWMPSKVTAGMTMGATAAILAYLFLLKNLQGAWQLKGWPTEPTEKQAASQVSWPTPSWLGPKRSARTSERLNMIMGWVGTST